MIEVIPKNDSDLAFEKAMDNFKKLVTKDGSVKELQERRYFKKPSEVVREKRRRQQKQLRNK